MYIESSKPKKNQALQIACYKECFILIILFLTEVTPQSHWTCYRLFLVED